MYRRWFMVALLTGMLALAITGGTVLAQSDGSEEGSPVKTLAARVAVILGLDEGEVQDAMQQAHEEMRDEGMQRKLDQMVENGRLTQEQADEALEWAQSRPEGMGQGHGPRGFGMHRMHRGRMMGGSGHVPGHHQAPPPAPETDDSDLTSL